MSFTPRALRTAGRIQSSSLYCTKQTTGAPASPQGARIVRLAIAKEENIGSSYVTRLVYLGCLSPDIVETILSGRQPPELSAERLVRMVPLPLDWREQRKLLGMAA